MSIERWLECRGYYKMEGPLFYGFWSWWGKLRRPPRTELGETSLDVAIEEQTRLERTITAVLLEIGFPVLYSDILLAAIGGALLFTAVLLFVVAL